MSLTPVLKQSCPACTAKVALFTRPALSTRRLVDGLLVKCQQGVEGCGQTHLLSEREHHLQYEVSCRQARLGAESWKVGRLEDRLEVEKGAGS